MQVGILGTGGVGQALGTGFAALGHAVKMGSREPQAEAVQAWVRQTGPLASAGTPAEAAAFGEVVVLATGWGGTENALKLAGADAFAGKLVIDVTNPLGPGPDGIPGLVIGHTDSAGEQVQRWLPNAKVVKAFNIITAGSMVNPDFPGGPPDMFICGNDEAAKAQTAQILNAFGWPAPIDVGDIRGARLLEPLAMLWITYGFRTGTWSHAFKLLRK